MKSKYSSKKQDINFFVRNLTVAKTKEELQKELRSIIPHLPKKCSSYEDKRVNNSIFSARSYQKILEAILGKYFREQYYFLLLQKEQEEIINLFIDQWYPITTVKSLVNLHSEEKEKGKSEISKEQGLPKKIIKMIIKSPVISKCIVSELVENVNISTKILSLLPDKVGVRGKSFKMFLQNCFEGLINLPKNRERKKMLQFVISLVKRLCSRGFGTLCAKVFIWFIQEKLENPLDFLRMFLTEYIRKEQRKVILKFLLVLLKRIEETENVQDVMKTFIHCISIMLEDKTETYKEIRTIFSNSLFLEYQFLNEPKTQVILIEIGSSVKEIKFEILRNITILWKQMEFQKFASKFKQVYVFKIMMFLLEKTTKEEVNQKKQLGKVKNDVVHYLMRGVQNRLSSNVKYVRMSGKIIGSKISQLIGERIKFGEFDDGIEKMEMEYTQMFKKYLGVPVIQKNHVGINENVKEKGIDDRIVKEKQAKREGKTTFDPNANIFDDEKNWSEEESDEGESNYDDDDDDETKEEIDSDTDSLQSFGLEDESNLMEELAKVKKPRFLRDLVPLLTAKQDDEHVVDQNEMALKYGEELVRKHTEDLDVISGKVCRCLIYLSDNYNLPDFDKNKTNFLVALLVCSTDRCVGVCIREFYGKDLTISTRIEVLLALRLAAMELSNRHINTRPPERKKLIKVQEEEEKKSEERLKEISKKYPKNTRIWGKRIKKDIKQKKGVKNDFLEHAESFFFPLIKDYDRGRHSRMLEDDHFILSELVTSLGTFVFCCGKHYVGEKIALSLMDFLWVIKYQSAYFATGSSKKRKIEISKKKAMEKDENDAKGIVSVRRSILFALQQVFSVMNKETLSNSTELVGCYVEWLFDVEQNDGDNSCRDFARNALMLLKELI